jgi:dTDP-4-dehydrorhamnose 3,5-epimerase
MRASSPTFLKWISVELNARELRSLYVPAGCAHGFQTLEDSTDVFYQISQQYAPRAAAGVRWNDPLVDIDWPMIPTVISTRDRTLPLLDGRRSGKEFQE